MQDSGTLAAGTGGAGAGDAGADASFGCRVLTMIAAEAEITEEDGATGERAGGETPASPHARLRA